MLQLCNLIRNKTIKSILHASQNMKIRQTLPWQLPFGILQNIAQKLATKYRSTGRITRSLTLNLYSLLIGCYPGFHVGTFLPRVLYQSRLNW